MIAFQCNPTEVDAPLQRLVRRVVSGQATDAEIEQARRSAGMSPLEAMLVAEILRRETSTTFIGDVLHPLCGC
jgi:hypothetical protein